MWKIWRAPNNASRWQVGFNSAFKGLNLHEKENKISKLYSQKYENHQTAIIVCSY